MKYFIPFSLIFICNCQTFFYYPDKIVHYPPEKLNIKYTDAFIPAGAMEIHSRFFPAQTASANIKGTIVQFHGNAENITSHYLSLVWCTRNGYNLFTFDYPGYGRSSGKTTRGNIRKAMKYVMEYIQTKAGSAQWGNELYMYGQSLGGIILMEALLANPPIKQVKGIILESTFDSYVLIALSKLTAHWYSFPLIPFLYIVINDWGAPHGRLKHLYPGVPKLVFHGSSDQVVPQRFGEHIYRELSEPKEIHIIEGAGHLGLYNLSPDARHDKTKRILLQFLEKSR